MQTANEGGENKDLKAPEGQPVETNKEEKKPDPTAGEEKKDNNQVEQLLEASNMALGAAEKRIVELKKELKERGGGESSGDIEDLREQIGNLTAEVEELKTTRVPKEDKDEVETVLQETRKKLSELSATIISQKTMGKGEGGNKDGLKVPEVEPEALAKTPQEIAILARRGLDKFGKKIAK